MLPVLRTGEAVIVGEAVSLPIRTLIDRPSSKRRPDSAEPKVVVPGSEAEGYRRSRGMRIKSAILPTMRKPLSYGVDRKADQIEQRMVRNLIWRRRRHAAKASVIKHHRGDWL